LIEIRERGRIVFNLYFAGPVPKYFDYLLVQSGDLVLLSYALAKGAIKKRHANNRPTFIDSGAYSAHTKGAVINVDAYIDFLNTYNDQCTIAAQVDKIPGEYKKPKTRQQLEEAPEISWQNFLYMRERLNNPNKLLPIFHQGEDMKHLHRMLNFEPGLDYIGISPANDLMRSHKAKWCDVVWNIIAKSNNPKIKTHAFGMTSIDLLEWYPWYSADSATWTLAAAYGKILLDLRQKGEEYTISVKNPNNELAKSSKLIFEEIKNYVESCGFDFHAMQNSLKERRRWNIFYLVNWANNYQYKPKTIKQNKLF
jgi:hypothetical protein